MSSFCRRTLLLVVFLFAVLMMASSLHAQAPIALPNTISTFAGGGGGTTSASKGVACVTGSIYTTTDTFGDGCPATQGILNSTDVRGGVVVDGAGNVFISDTSNSIVRRVDGKTGIINRFVGGGVACGSANGQLDSNGDGCPLFQTVLSANPRGMGIDPYGNVLIAGYGSDYVTIACQAISPLCPGGTGYKQVGYLYRIAGCAGSATSAGVSTVGATPGTAGDGLIASPYGNLSGDVATWGSANSSAGYTIPSGMAACSTTSGAFGSVDQPRGVAADKYGNVYIADTANNRYRVVVGPASWNSVSNPLAAVIALNSATYNGIATNTITATSAQGRIYPILGTFTAPSSGAYCNGSSGAKALDAKGDGCPYYQTTVGSGPQGIAVDSSGDVIFGDNANSLLRVMYMGGTAMACAIELEYPTTFGVSSNNCTTATSSPVQGSVYVLAGGGATGISLVPTLGTSTTLDTGIYKVTVDPSGDIVIGDAQSASSNVYFFDINTGYIRKLFATGSACGAALDTAGDGCAASAAVWSGANAGLGVAFDSQGNLYISDSETASTGSLIRKVSASNLVAPALNGSLAQTLVLHGAASTTTMTAALLSASPDIAVGTPVCGVYVGTTFTAGTSAGDSTRDCQVPITFAPLSPGGRAAALVATASGSTGTAILPLESTVKGSALVADSSATTTAALGSSLTPVGVAVDGSSSVYTIDTNAGKYTKITSSGTVSQLSLTPVSNPKQVAADGSGNVYIVNGTNAITKLSPTSGGAFTSSTITVPGSIGVTGVSIAAAGSGYTTAPGVIVSGGGCTGVVMTASTNFTGTAAPVNAINIINAGTCTSTPTITLVATTGSGATATVTGGGTAVTPTLSAIAVDALGNLYVGDNANNSVYEIPAATNFSTAQPTITLVSRPSGSNISSLAVDAAGNIDIADKGAGKIYKISATNGILSTVSVTGTITPVGVAGDAAGDVYIQDSTSNSVIEVPVSGPQTTVLTGLTTPTGIAVDGNGALYSADSHNTSITQVQRNAVTYGLGTSNATTQLGTVTNVGNLAATGLVQTGSNTNAFALAGGTSNGCAASGVAVTTSTAVAIGNACTLQATLATSGTGAVTDAVTFNETTTTQTAGSLTVTGTLTGTATGTTTTISGESPASPVYVASGTTVSFTVTVAPASGVTAPTGTISYTLDSNAPVSGVALTTSGSNGVGTIALSGITAGSHTLVATYPATGSFATSTSTPTTSFSVAKASTSVSWTPGATTQTVSSAVGAAVLDATSGGSLPGAFSYTATPSGGSASSVDASSYLALGTYSLGVTFTPTDSVDYNTSTGSVGTYTVTQASTTAPVGASQFLVASDGTGNYTTIQSAVNAVGVSGGSVYIKPGTYSGMITVVQPNVSLRGLGGVPQNVILTHAGGAFSVNPGTVYNYAGEFNTSISNGYQLPSGSSQFSGDEGSATLVVAKGMNTTFGSSTFLPYNFYAENLSLINTFDSDNVTTTTTYVSGGVCTANAGTAQTYSFLYNAGTECASQALAIWITGDQAVLNNVYTTSLQDTVYAGSGGCGSPCTVSRQYWWNGKITGDVDYIFGDAAAVFDHDNIYTTWHGNSATGTETIEAQNKSALTGGGSDYLSGYVFNGSTFTSQSTGMTNLNYGRPYGTYSTTILLNSYVDQVTAAGWIEFSGDTNLPTSTYTEFNTSQYTDPSTGSADLNGITYLGTGGNTGSGVTGTREATSQDPGTAMASNTIKTQMTAAQAAAYYPVAFLGTKIGSGGIGTLSTGSTAIWNPATTLATDVNAFVPSATTATVNAGGSITILMRPQTPGGGVLPTGTYTLLDGVTTLASGSLDASGEAYYTTNALSTGSHSITWTYGGDANFTGSTTSTPLGITVTAGPFNTTTTIAVTNASTTYGTVVTGSVTVAPTSGTGNPTGTITLLLDGVSAGTYTLNTGAYTFSLSGISAGSHTLTASYAGDANNNSSSTSSGTSLTVAKGTLTVAAVSTSRTFGQANPTLTYTMTGFAYSDNQSSATTGLPSITTTAVRISPVGSYPITAAAGTLASSNYTISYTAGTLAVNSGAAQTIKFLKLPAFPSGRSYQLSARASSGLAVTYTITAGSSNASVSGSTLTVNAGSTGVSITVQAAQAGNGTYAAATSVSQSFTAQ